MPKMALQQVLRPCSQVNDGTLLLVSWLLSMLHQVTVAHHAIYADKRLRSRPEAPIRGRRASGSLTGCKRCLSVRSTVLFKPSESSLKYAKPR